MKKILLCLILFLIPIKTWAISADAYVVMDMDSKRVIEGKNIKKESLIASTTKIMTGYLAIKYGNLDEKVKTNEDILKAYGSSIYLEVGEQIKLKDLVYGLMLRSGNDAAIVIANNISNNTENFVKLMNDVAKKSGMSDTQFYNPHGLEENNGKGNTSTVYDMALLTIEAMKSDIYREIVGTKSIKVKTNFKTYTWYNKNKLLSYYKYTTGGKTGFTKKAGRTLVTTASMDNKRVVIVTFKDGNDFKNHQNLYNKVFKNYEKITILNKNSFKSQDTYYNKKLYLKKSYSVLLTSKEKENIRIEEEIVKKDNFKDGDKVGKVKIYLYDSLLYEDDLFLNKPSKVTFFKKIWSRIKLWLM